LLDRCGKVVGKRRKRPIDDSIGNINSKSWVVTTIPIQSIPSPATTQTPEDHSKRQSSQPPWATFIPTPGEPGFLTFDEPIDSLNAVDMTDHRSLSMANQMHFVDAMPGYFDHGVPQTTNKAEYEYLAMLVQEVMAIVSTVGDLLKMKPLQPFQYLGRHETLHVELECRLREASMLLH
ncbi:hypothetical protein B0A52_00669, partial [Exophiala mesophila]